MKYVARHAAEKARYDFILLMRNGVNICEVFASSCKLIIRPRYWFLTVSLSFSRMIRISPVRNTPPVTAAITLKKIFSARIFLRLDAFPSLFSEYALNRLCPSGDNALFTPFLERIRNCFTVGLLFIGITLPIQRRGFADLCKKRSVKI